VRPVLVLALVSGALCAAAAGLAASDKGSDRPPGRLTEDQKSIWMTEWVSCRRLPMGSMSRILQIPVRAWMTPQLAAKKLANRAVYLLYNTQEETMTAADGCRNGILWRYYHPQS
jgi:hypothetical protein